MGLLTKEQVTRFYETLALLVAKREGVDIKVVSVELRKTKEDGEQQEEKSDGQSAVV